MAAIVKAMASPESGLEVRDRMWLKITIPNAFIGERAPWWDEGQGGEQWGRAGRGAGRPRTPLGHSFELESALASWLLRGQKSPGQVGLPVKWQPCPQARMWWTGCTTTWKASLTGERPANTPATC